MKPDLKIGDFVKVLRGGERFWLIVEGRSDEGGYVGKVNNRLLDPNACGCDFGDSIPFIDAEIMAHIRREK